MIGAVFVPSLNAHAVLQDDGSWWSTLPPLAEHLDLAYSPAKEPSVGGAFPYGVASLVRAARDLGGTLSRQPDVPPVPRGVNT